MGGDPGWRSTCPFSQRRRCPFTPWPAGERSACELGHSSCASLVLQPAVLCRCLTTPCGPENKTGLYLETVRPCPWCCSCRHPAPQCPHLHTQNGILLFARNLLRNDMDLQQPCVTPMNGECGGLPPTLLVTNGHDPPRDVGHAYARKLAAAGTQITHLHHPHLTHSFPQFTRRAPGCHRAWQLNLTGCGGQGAPDMCHVQQNSLSSCPRPSATCQGWAMPAARPSSPQLRQARAAGTPRPAMKPPCSWRT